MDADGASCMLKTNTWRHLKPRPPNCDVDWVPTDVSLYVSRKTRRWAVEVGGCRGDVGPLCYGGDPCTILRYGQSVSSVIVRRVRQGIRCTSDLNGITCRKLGPRKGARGFRISKEGYAAL
jgi:hypothetical protein